jgi:hypothetical protein
VRVALPWLVCALVAASGCANRGMQAPDDPFAEGGAGGSPGTGTGGMGTGGTPIPGTGGSGGSPPATGGRAGGTGGSGSGGTAGGGGASGGHIGTGGASGGTGGGATGGAAGTPGTGGAAGAKGTGGVAGSGGSGGGGRGGAAGSTGGAGGGGRGGAGGLMCPMGGTLDCSSAGALKVSDGKITDFSSAQWNATTGEWCDGSGLRGHPFSFAGTGSTSAAVVDATAQNLKLNVTVGKTDYAGGGIMFDSCVNASAFTSVQFTASLSAGSLDGCVWQIQLQTQDQRTTAATNPTGGTCTTNCERYPVVANLTVPTATAAPYTEAFTLFTNQTGSTIPMATQVVGVQWQVNSSNGTGTCTAELRIDDVIFK